MFCTMYSIAASATLGYSIPSAPKTVKKPAVRPSMAAAKRVAQSTKQKLTEREKKQIEDIEMLSKMLEDVKSGHAKEAAELKTTIVCLEEQLSLTSIEKQQLTNEISQLLAEKHNLAETNAQLSCQVCFLPLDCNNTRLLA